MAWGPGFRGKRVRQYRNLTRKSTPSRVAICHFLRVELQKLGGRSKRDPIKISHQGCPSHSKRQLPRSNFALQVKQRDNGVK
jgi:hypothetical protein